MRLVAAILGCAAIFLLMFVTAAIVYHIGETYGMLAGTNATIVAMSVWAGSLIFLMGG